MTVETLLILLILGFAFYAIYRCGYSSGELNSNVKNAQDRINIQNKLKNFRNKVAKDSYLQSKYDEFFKEEIYGER